ncbi:MAG: preprotein translocase subunit SecE, partial [Clostridia bacterium]|nr:preprotein translocase subunit SecE [Clostridia bacterium]
MAKAEKTEKAGKKQKHFWKDFRAELKKVIWPTRSQVVKNTIIVVAIVIIVTAIVFVVDVAMKACIADGIDKVK